MAFGLSIFAVLVVFLLLGKTIDAFEAWRYPPSAGCPNCYHYGRACHMCREARKRP